MKTAIFERIYKRLLREAGAPSVDGYGAVVYGGAGYNIVTVIYDVPTLEDALLDAFSSEEKAETLGSKELNDIIAPSIVGYVNITKPAAPCWDAYQIAMIAGPGKIVYGCAYATSPSGLMISDRDSMTTAAVSAWRSMAAKGTRGKKKLDNTFAPITPEPEDDCDLRKEDFLNYAYESEGWEKDMLEGMKAEHEALKKRLTSAGGTLGNFAEREIRVFIRTAGRKFFDDEYGG